VRQMGGLVNKDLYWQHHLSTLRFPFIQHEESIMVRQRYDAKLRG
jgi:hypothetical protein